MISNMPIVHGGNWLEIGRYRDISSRMCDRRDPQSSALPDRILTIPLDGAALHARTWRPPGCSAGPAIVLLHEALGSVSRWQDFPAVLAARTGLATMAFDRAGHGLSPARATAQQPSYLTEQARDVLPAILAATGLPRPVLYGHSDGATIALIYAALYPDRVAGVIAEAPHVIVEPITREGIIAARAAFREPRLFARLARHHGDKTQALLDGWSDIWLSDAFRTWSVVDLMARIAAPVLLVQGVGDAYGSRDQLDLVADRAAGPVSVALLQDCGHSPHREARGLVLEQVERFLARMPDAKPQARLRADRPET